MTRPAVEVADILRAQGRRFLDRYRSSLDFQQLKALRAIQRCRTAVLGGHRDACPSCGYQAISYNSCRNRHCPKCQTQARERWITARRRELLDTSYFHVVFTVPHELNVLALENPRLFYDLLFAATAQTLLGIASDVKHLGAEIGVIAILHTWGQNLLLHPHIHCVIPAGGLSRDHRRWLRPRYPFFLPVKVLSRVFRGKFLAGLKRLHRRKKFQCAGPAAALADSRQFSQFIRRLHRHDWVVYAKPAFGGPMQVLRYLGRYTHRVAISNHRLLAFDQERVTFRWKDYARGGRQGQMTLTATEFLRRFFLHVLPKGFVRIRHFGFLANRFRASRLALGRQLLASSSATEQGGTCDLHSENAYLWHCPRCGASMIVIQRFTAAELCMHILRFFLTHASAPMRGCAPARRSIRVYTLARRPVSRLSSDTRVSLSNTGHGLDQSFLCLLTRLPHSKLPFKSHSAPRLPQTPAASS